MFDNEFNHTGPIIDEDMMLEIHDIIEQNNIILKDYHKLINITKLKEIEEKYPKYHEQEEFIIFATILGELIIDYYYEMVMQLDMIHPILDISISNMFQTKNAKIVAENIVNEFHLRTNINSIDFISFKTSGIPLQIVRQTNDDSTFINLISIELNKFIIFVLKNNIIYFLKAAALHMQLQLFLKYGVRILINLTV